MDYEFVYEKDNIFNGFKCDELMLLDSHGKSISSEPYYHPSNTDNIIEHQIGIIGELYESGDIQEDDSIRLTNKSVVKILKEE